MFLGELDDAFEEVEFDALGGRVGRKSEDHHLGLRVAFADRTFEFSEEVDVGTHANGADVGTGDDGAVDVDRIAGIGHEHGVATVERGEHQVRETFFGTDGDDRFAVGIELDVVAFLVPMRDGAPQSGNALG